MSEDMEIEAGVRRLVEVAARESGGPLVATLRDEAAVTVAAGHLVAGDGLQPAGQEHARLEVEAHGIAVIGTKPGRDLRDERQRTLDEDQRGREPAVEAVEVGGLGIRVAVDDRHVEEGAVRRHEIADVARDGPGSE